MHGTRFDRLLAGTAVALILAVAPASAQPAGAPADDAAIAAAVPLPEPADVPPPTIADIDAPATTEPAQAQRDAAVPMPEPANVPPPTAADIGAPAAEPAQAKRDAVVPMPEPANVPPPTAADIGTVRTPDVASPAVPSPAVATQPATAAVPPAGQPSPPAGQPSPPAAASAPAAEPTTAAIPTPPPTPTLDQQVGDSLRAALAKAGKRDKMLEAFYTARDFAPVFVIDGAASPRTRAANAYLAKVDAHGLDPSDYALPEIKSGAEPAALAETELKIATTLATYARHATNGRVHYSRVSADVHYPPHDFDPAEALAKIAGASDVAATLDGFNPQQPGYKALVAKLKELRGQGDEPEPVRIPAGPTLRLAKDKAGSFMQDERVPLIRKRLGLAGDAADTSYDEALAEAVRSFQRQNGLSPDGLLGNRTVDALNGGKKREKAEDVIIANMERWRWLPQDLGRTHVMLNIPDFTLRVVRDGKTVWTTRVVVGKPSTPTPILTETMKYITVNPTWNVPPSIVYNEYLPALQQDPTVLDRMGLKLTQNRDGSVHISQPPGERNALGRIRFNFPNKFLVYQHDTPDKHLFAKDVRAYSHGCMRVQDPAKYAEVLLGIALPGEGYTADRITKMYGSGERNIQLPTPIPVHITYQTAFVDDTGKLQLRDDIYGRDTRVMAALNGADRRVADVPVDRPQQSYARPPVRLPERYASGYNSGGPSFFERLFGGGWQNEPPPVRNNFRRYNNYYSR